MKGIFAFIELPPRPKSMLDFTRLEHKVSSLPRRSKTPTAGHQSTPYDLPLRSSSLKPSLSHSTPNLLDDLDTDPSFTKLQSTLSLKQKPKHKVCTWFI